MASVQIIIIGVLTTGIGLLAYLIIKSITAPKRIEGIQKLIKQGKYVQAVKLAKSILVRDPHDFMAHYYLGRAYLADSKSELALMEYQIVDRTAIFGIDLPEITFRQELANLYMKFKQPDEALKQYLLLTKQDPRNAENFYNAGRIYDQQEHADVALGFYQKAIQLNSRHSKAHAAMGLILYHAKQFADAKKEIDLAITLSPETYSNYYYLGKILKGNKDYSAAVQAFEKSFRDPEYRQRALLERGTCFMLGESYDNAIGDLDRAIHAEKDSANRETVFARYFLAACYEKQRKIEKAIEQWKIIYTQNHDFRDVAAKLTEYQDLQSNDNMKEYLTCAGDDFRKLCEKTTLSGFNMTAQQTDLKNDSCQIIATEKGSDNWRNVRKQLILLWFIRDTDPQEDAIVRQMLDKLKELNCTKGILLSSSGFTRAAVNFAENRPVELINREKLETILTKAGA